MRLEAGMKKLLLSSAALLALVGAANAADLPVRAPAQYAAPAVVPPPPSWTGLYVGGGWGYGVWDTNSTATFLGVPQGTTNNSGRGFFGMVDVGYDYQFNLAGWNLVAGVLADYDFGNLKGTENFQILNGFAGVNASVTGVEKEKSFWDAGARIGWLITPDILSYFSGGYSQARFNGMTLTPFAVPLSTSSHNYGGWFTGAGIETKIQSVPGLYFNTEYRFTSYNNATLPVAGSGGAIALKLQPSQQTVMSGLHYKFNW
jgi:outer membrane immunogenic protein